LKPPFSDAQKYGDKISRGVLAFENVMPVAAGAATGVQFASGDQGNEYANVGVTDPTYPAASRTLRTSAARRCRWTRAAPLRLDWKWTHHAAGGMPRYSGGTWLLTCGPWYRWSWSLHAAGKLN
jgi:hypothetical protein